MKKYLCSLIVILFCIFHYGFSQDLSKSDWHTFYRQLENDYVTGVLSKDEYLATIDSLTERLTVSGLSYTSQEISHLLSKFREIVWKNTEKYGIYKANYFRFLMNNALASGRSGEALFYAEKNEKETSELGKKTLLIPYLKLIIWAKSKNNDKVIELYEEQRQPLDSLLAGIPDERNIASYMQAMQFYFYVTQPLLQTNQPQIEEVIRNVVRLGQIIGEHYPEIKNKKINHSIPVLLSLFCQIEYYAHHANRLKEKQMIDSAFVVFNIANTELGPYLRPYENILNSMALKYFLAIKDNRNAKIFLQKLTDGIQIFDDEASNLYQYKARLEFNYRNYEYAYSLIDSALQHKSVELTTAYEEMNNLWYAYTEAEHNKIELIEKEIVKNRQKIWIGIIAFIAFGILISAVLLIRREKQNNIRQLKTLNELTDVAIRDARIFAAKAEQKRLGQDLHDEYSASLISIVHNIELLSRQTDSDKVKNDLGHLKERVGLVYNSIRNKSHEIYNYTTEREYSFEESIVRITDATLHSSSYLKNIDIDSFVAAALDLQQRIELIKILQEATSNILKHSKANEVSIFLFRDGNKAIFQISDNGIGTSKGNVYHGLGLKSIQNRAASMMGSLEMVDDEGITLVITFPLNIV